MTDLHPNWDATDGGEESIPVHAAAVSEPPAETPHATSVSRQPAAVAGILISISIGFALYLGFGPGVHGGLSSASTIRITSAGFTPAHVTISQGEEITWINDRDTAQALQSDELCTTARQCFATTLFAPGSSASLTITSDFMPGTYRYYSITTQDMEGSITVTAATKAVRDSLGQHQANLENALPVGDSSASAEAASSSAESSVMSDTASSVSSADPEPEAPEPEAPIPDPIPEASSSSETSEPEPLPAADSSSSSSCFYAIPIDCPSGRILSGTEQTGADGCVRRGAWCCGDYLCEGEESALGCTEDCRNSSASSVTRPPTIPVNPYTVGSPRGSSTTKTGATSSEALHGGAPRPLSQPETGPTIWIVIALALSALFALTQRSLSKHHS